MRRAFLETEGQFLSAVRKGWDSRPEMGAVGTCCLVGVICGGSIYVANAGDSRAVLGTRCCTDGGGRVVAIQLSEEHNANLEDVRNQLRSLHPDDSGIVVLKHHVWRVKGIIQVSRSIGDAYLKKPEFNKHPLPLKFRLPEPFRRPILTPEPAINVRKLHQRDDLFLIFASDGLWDHLSSQEAVDIVANNPRPGIARKLVETALHAAADKREIRYPDLKNIAAGVRRHFHDDITAVVVFLHRSSITTNRSSSSKTLTVSVKGGDTFLNPD
ncbi:hypothetical protein M569_07544 [Genlisea aurea]|uniref:PPM-type phosphatase domain-containing protein n=1 Tax=Genlisea aurea TaxID=192259 RepID=S8E4I4_9LAMI|nr:hypothetical protein M569_07544 [Genlisea aurea]